MLSTDAGGNGSFSGSSSAPLGSHNFLVDCVDNAFAGTPNREIGTADAPVLLSPDSDADGLSDAEEALLGTDPSVPDTDADGLLDGTEVDLQQSLGVPGCPDPLVADSDGDTLLDGEEVALTTNPCDPDTDDDGVDDGIDPLPLDPGVPPSYVDQELRALCDVVALFDLGLIDARNDNARAGRRNAMCNKLSSAANAMAAGDYQEALDQLASLQRKLDGAPAPPDWMVDSLERVLLHDELDLLSFLIELL